MENGEENKPDPQSTTVPAGALEPWGVADLPPTPSARGWRLWAALLGPGLVMAGVAIGSGEWLFGPAVTARYGPSLLWLASISILLQVFCNLMMTRYAVYCGEPIIVGGLRTRPGPRLWAPVYLLLDVAMLFPYNAANAAVALAALLHWGLPPAGDPLVRALGYVVFLLAFVPLIFGGTIYRTVEWLMTFKVFYVLGFLSVVAVLMVSGKVWWDVARGFVQVGTVPLRAETIVVAPHFHVEERRGDTTYTVRGTLKDDVPDVAELTVARGGQSTKYNVKAGVPAELGSEAAGVFARALKLVQPGRFFVRDREGAVTLTLTGEAEGQRWRGTKFTVADAGGERRFTDLESVPEPHRDHMRELLANQGVTHVNLVGYTRAHGALPPLDWFTLASFAAIAGIGGLGNTLFSNYARDKGWGMGAHVGAIPSMIGGRKISLSHTGRVFPLDEGNRSRWRSWMHHIRRDQVVWTVANFVGMALPCMISLEFIRHATVQDHRVAAMAAEGMAGRYPSFFGLFWVLTLFCGFVILAPGQVTVCDMLARRWTDIVWTGTRWARRLPRRGVTYIYYGILVLYAVAGVVALSFFSPFQIAKIAAVLMNVALGVSAWHSLYVNRSLMPRELRPSWLLQAGTVVCGLFFIGISVVVLLSLLGVL